MLQGVFVGVVGSGVFLFLSLMVKQWLWPKYVDSTYKGPQIKGEWQVYFEGIEEVAAELTFSQSGTKITGYSAVSKNRLGEKVDRKYQYLGSLLTGSVVLTFEDVKKHNAAGGAMVFHTTDSDGLSMKGKSIYFKPEFNEVVVTNAIMKKKST